MPEEKPAPDQAAELLFGLQWGWLASRGIHVAAELGIADLLRDGPKTVDHLASATGAHRQSLYRLLRMLASYGVFAEDSAGRFDLTPAAELLQTGVLRDAARRVGEAEWNAYGTSCTTSRRESLPSSIFMELVSSITSAVIRMRK
jgi:sugar-specific transcriptional regulator TrmB